MTEREALLAAILDEPDEDTHRLVYADWLQENAGTVTCPACNGAAVRWKGDITLVGKDRYESPCSRCSGSGRVSNGYAARGEFIRVQVELARLGSFPTATARGKAGLQWKYEKLRERERDLLLTRGLEWVPRIDEKNTFELILSPRWEFTGTPACEFRRGFVSAITCSCADFLQHAAAIWREQPVTGVSLGDREPRAATASWPDGPHGHVGWWADPKDDYGGLSPSNCDLPRAIWERLAGYKKHRTTGSHWRWYRTEADAQSALSAACVQLGRARARAARGTVGTQPEVMR